MDISDVRGMTALRASLKFIDSVPSDAPLPAMPGFDRDWMESMIAGYTEDQPVLSLGEALGMCLEWIDEIPPEVRNTLQPFDTEGVRAERDRLSSRPKAARPK
jgi:hypothetical protein